jgi:hypothetical protein
VDRLQLQPQRKLGPLADFPENRRGAPPHRPPGARPTGRSSSGAPTGRARSRSGSPRWTAAARDSSHTTG